MQPHYPWSVSTTTSVGSSLECFEISIENHHHHLLNGPIRWPTNRGAGDPHKRRQFDLTQSTEWMEYLEIEEDRLADVGGAGAYDTLRCDLVLNSNNDADGNDGDDDDANNGSSSNRPLVRIWGEDFHLERLQASYKSLFNVGNNDDDEKKWVENTTLQVALNESRATLQRLVREAKNSTFIMTSVSDGDVVIQLLRLTLLWSPPKDRQPSSSASGDVVHKIVVRGHACSSCVPIKIHSKPDPIVVSVAVHGRDDGSSQSRTDDDSQINRSSASVEDDAFPTRYANPQSKIASWCRIRKTLEDPDAYKPPGTSEVLMVRPRLDVEGHPRIQVLEGLSSNFFVVYKNGCLRTATSGVLYGYVRHLVLEVASKCGLRFDPQPIYLHQRAEWKEAFITSSSRLIYPISSILIPKDADVVDIDVKRDIDLALSTTTSSLPSTTTSFVEYWRDPYFANLESDSDVTAPKWQELLNELLKVGGYDPPTS